jgi:hypothetical protein
MNVPAAEVPFTQPLAGDLLVAYAVDIPGAFRMISTGEVAALEVTHARLHEVAAENLRRGVHLQVTVRPPLVVVQTGGDLEACVLLLDEV